MQTFQQVKGKKHGRNQESDRDGDGEHERRHAIPHRLPAIHPEQANDSNVQSS